MRPLYTAVYVICSVALVIAIAGLMSTYDASGYPVTSLVLPACCLGFCIGRELPQ